MLMSQDRQVGVEQLDERKGVEDLGDLSAADRAWLEERLKEYREFLAYLRDH